MKKRLFLHIGTHKTGTTAIQSFLQNNVGKLLEQGVLFPQVGFIKTNHSPLSWFFHDPKYLPQGAVPADRQALVDSGPDHLWSALHEVAAGSSADTIVISGEGFSLIESPQVLTGYCEPFETTVIVYLRQQYAYLLSLYNQDVRSELFHRTEPYEDFLQDNRMLDFLHYDRMLEPWAKAFGKNNIIVGRYDKPALKEGLIADFAKKIGVTVDQDWKVTTDTINRSLPMPLTELKRLINRQQLTSAEHTNLNAALQRVTERLEVRDWLVNNWEYPRAAAYSDIVERYKESNKMVAREYFGLQDEPLFSGLEHTVTPGSMPAAETILMKTVPPLISELSKDPQRS